MKEKQYHERLHQPLDSTLVGEPVGERGASTPKADSNEVYVCSAGRMGDEGVGGSTEQRLMRFSTTRGRDCEGVRS